MRCRYLTVLLNTAGLVGIFLWGTNAAMTSWAAAAEDLPPPIPAGEQRQGPAVEAAAPEGVEVLTRGPVHEAFAEPVLRSPAPTAVVPKRAPDPIEELPPDQRPEGENVVWIPGYWAWDADSQNFLWVSGTWRVAPPGRQWVPGHWDQVEGGSQWVPGFWTTMDTAEVEYLPAPPEPITEATPSAPDDSSTYVPGTWVWRDARYRWRAGYYTAYQPGWVWVSPGYSWTPAGYVFVDGYWDRPLRTRGLLFAPVAIDPRYLGRPNWAYRPSYVVSEDFLMGALFVRPEVNSYYYGDYFEPQYRKQGFVPWVDFRVGRDHYDSLFSYYRREHRDDPRWARDLNSLYVDRREGKAARPPRTFVQQRTLVQDFNDRRGNNLGNVQHLTAVTALQNVNNKVVRLVPVPRTQLDEARNHVTQMRRVTQERSQIEARLARQEPTGKTGAAPRVAKFNLPKVASALNTPEKSQAPPLPRLPQPETRPGSHGDTVKPPQPRPGTGTAKQPEEPVRPTPRPGTEKPPVEQPKPTPKPGPAKTPPTTPEPTPTPKPGKPVGESPKPVKPVTPPPAALRPEDHPRPITPPPEPKPPARPSAVRPAEERPRIATPPPPPEPRPAPRPPAEREPAATPRPGVREEPRPVPHVATPAPVTPPVARQEARPEPRPAPHVAPPAPPPQPVARQEPRPAPHVAPPAPPPQPVAHQEPRPAPHVAPPAPPPQPVAHQEARPAPPHQPDPKNPPK